MNENKMETMPVNKLLITMAAPMVLSMLIGALYNVVDSLFVSNYGENALSAVSLAFPIQNIIIATGTGIGVGINALLSRFLGEKKQKKVNQTGLIIMEMLPVQLISAFAPSEEMFSLGVTGLRILGFSFVFGGVSVMTCYALQGFSRGISSLIISALRQVIILLPLASILGKVIGINGIWWSFLISETVTVTVHSYLVPVTDFADASHSKSTKSATTTVSYGIFSLENACL